MSEIKKVEKIYYKALEAVKANNIVRKNLRVSDEYLTVVDNNIKLSSFKKLYLYSVGKAGYDMAKTAEDILGDKISGGVAVSLKKKDLKYIKHITSTHPIVSKKSIMSAKKIIESAKQIDKDDLFIFLLSGGASAMVEKPIDGISFKDLKKISKALIVSGIDIKVFNSVRKNISSLKGGKLASKFNSKGFVLVLSDVIGDDLNIIGSAPMYNKKIPHFIIGSNKLALKEAKKYIQKYVQKTKILTTSLNTSSKKASKYITKEINKYAQKYKSYCLLIGGETTVKVKGDGFGGRNSELALRLLINKPISNDTVILCAGSDGIDGNSNANGAFLDSETYKKAKQKGLNPHQYLKNSDSHSFFSDLKYDFNTGITGTNVMDFVIVLKISNE